VGQATLVKSDQIAAAAGATNAVEVELGIGTDEAARILGVELAVMMTVTMAAALWNEVTAAYSFDPEDLVVAVADDEQFAMVHLSTSAIAASTGAMKQSEVVFMSFVGMNLLTTRNLALVLGVTGSAGNVTARVFYEKFKPTVNELNMLIAQRR